MEEKNKEVLSLADRLCEEFPGSIPVVYANDGSVDEIEDAIDRDYDVVVLGVFNQSRARILPELLRCLKEKRKPILAVLLNSPYDFAIVKECEAVLCAYEYTTLSVKALIRCMVAGVYEGVLPVRLDG